MPIMYFAHPMNIYDTPLETFLLRAIKKVFPSWQIENPNQCHHQTACAERKAAGQSPITYFYKRVLPDCAGGICLPFHDGAWGAEVYSEAQWLISHGRVVFAINHRGIIKPMTFKRQRVLTIGETQSRLVNQYGRRQPYFPAPPITLYD